MTTKNLSISQSTKFVSRLRNLIERYELVAIEQIGNERISRLSFMSRKDEKRNLYSEFFSHGNLILTDPTNDELIIDVASPQSFRHRTLAEGEKYILPPSRGVALQEIDNARLATIFQKSVESNEDQGISAIKWFGRNVGTSRKFVEEIFFRSQVNPSIPLKSLDQRVIGGAHESLCEYPIRA